MTNGSEREPERTSWRVGSHYPIHVYEGDRPVATFHTASDAARAVGAIATLNAVKAIVARARRELVTTTPKSASLGLLRALEEAIR